MGDWTPERRERETGIVKQLRSHDERVTAELEQAPAALDAGRESPQE